MAIFDIIFHDMTIRDILYLLAPFVLPTNLKGVFSNDKIRYFRGDDIADLPCLIVKEGLSEISRICFGCAQRIHYIRVVNKNLFHFSKTAQTTCLITQLANHTRLLHIKQIIWQNIPAHTQRIGDAGVVRLKRGTFSHNGHQTAQLTARGNRH